MTLASRTRKIGLAGSAASAAIAIGAVGIVAAPSAHAATSKPVVISAPSTVTSGASFTLNCKIKPKKVGKDWAGATAVVHEKGVAIHASRTVASNGACTMNLVLNSTGKHKLRVVVIGAQNVIKSQWVKIVVS